MTLLDFDPGRAADAVRHRDPEEMAKRYRRVFGGGDGKVVLLDLLVLARVAQVRPEEMTERAVGYHDGRASLALEILGLAGPDPVGATLAVMTTELTPPEGLDDHDRSSELEPGAEPGPASPQSCAEPGPAGPDEF